MSSTNKTANYELSQFVGTDIPSILNDYNGDMRKIDSAIHDASVAGGDNASAIAELQTSTARMNTEIGGINSTVNTIGGKVVAIEEVIPATASAQNKLLTAQDIPEIPSIEGIEQNVAELQENVDAIQLCIPSNASQSNKLATMEDIPSITQSEIADIKAITDSVIMDKPRNFYSSAEGESFVTAFNNAITNLQGYIGELANEEQLRNALLDISFVVNNDKIYRLGNFYVASGAGNNFALSCLAYNGGGFDMFIINCTLNANSVVLNTADAYKVQIDSINSTITQSNINLNNIYLKAFKGYSLE